MTTMRNIMAILEQVLVDPWDELYHGTSMAGAVQIALDNEFMTDDTNDDMGRGLSLTYNEEIAATFANDTHLLARQTGAGTTAETAQWKPTWAEWLASKDQPGVGGVILCLSQSHLRSATSLEMLPIEGEQHEEELRLMSGSLRRIGSARSLISHVKPIIPPQFDLFCQLLTDAVPAYRPAVAWLRSMVR